MELQIRCFVAGLCFGVWPLLMNRSGLSGNVSSAVFTAVILACVVPFAIRSGSSTLYTANWLFVICSAVLGAIGLLNFNGMLAKAKPEAVGILVVLMIIVETAVSGVYQSLMTGLTPIRIIGFITTAVSAILLLI